MTLGPIHPRIAAKVREVLGLPADAPLTERQCWKAAQLELEAAIKPEPTP